MPAKQTPEEAAKEAQLIHDILYMLGFTEEDMVKMDITPGQARWDVRNASNNPAYRNGGGFEIAMEVIYKEPAYGGISVVRHA